MHAAGRLAGVGAAALAFASLAAASATPVTPGRGAAVATSTPLFHWTVPEGETTTDVYVTSSRSAPPRDVVDSQVFSNGEKLWKPTRPLFAGAYWWTVRTKDAAGKLLYSAPSPFRVVASGRLSSLRLTRYTSSHHLFVSARWRSNAKTSVLALRVRRGSKLLWTERLPKTSIVPLTEEIGLTTWARPARVRQGTPLTLTATLQAGTFTQTLRRPFRAP